LVSFLLIIYSCVTLNTPAVVDKQLDHYASVKMDNRSFCMILSHR